MPASRRSTPTIARASLAALATIATPIALATLSGCVIGSRKSVQVTGRPIDPSLLNAIMPDETSETQVLDMLGPPSRSMAADSGGTIFVWDYQRTENSAGHVLLIFGGSSQRVEQQSVSILIRDGLVRRVWQS